MKNKIREAISDGLGVVGAGLLVYATARVAPDLGWFAAGAVCIIYGALIARGGNE
ncbi:MAG: hypothetical protein IJ960_00865 [Oscillospiraceae bacterium]|nr:hypothetical protein [Oscillospiraceae bacterium]